MTAKAVVRNQRRMELDQANAAIPSLKPLGDVSLVYATAEFAPFSNQFRPDLVFVPSIGRKSGQIFFAEFRFGRSKRLSQEEVALLPEHRSFVYESEGEIEYALATDEKLPPDTLAWLGEHDIQALDSIKSTSDLVAAILDWSGIAGDSGA